MYESQPGFYVTSSLFIPKGIKGKAPAVLYCSGHTDDGYRGPVYQHAILNLVNKGFIVFAFDPVSQGERTQYFDSASGKSVIGRATLEHSYAGAQAFITGSSQARYMIFDGIRAIDYLVTRKEVDPERIGITGRSGGGTQSAYIAAFDDRIYAAAPECYITSFRRLLQSIGPQDAEQNLIHEIAEGIDHADLLEVRAPKPAMMITTTNDFFSIQGARETADEVSSMYKVLGKENNFSRVEDVAQHASTKKNREAMYAFFQKFLKNPGNPEDENIPLLNPDELRVTPTGQVASSLHGETVFSLNRKDAELLLERLNSFREELSSHLNDVKKSACSLSGYRQPDEISAPVFTGKIIREDYEIEKYFLKGEGNYVIPYLLFIPEHPSGKAIIYISSTGKNNDAVLGGKIEWFVHNNITVLAPDLPGIGEIGPDNFGGDSGYKDNEGRNVSYNIWFAGVLTGRSIAGIQAGEVVRLVHLLKHRPGISEVYGLADKSLSPVLLHAAVFEPDIRRIVLLEPYLSYASIVMNRFYNPGYTPGTVAGALEVYDLPDLEACLAPKKLLMVNIRDQSGKPASPDTIMNELQVVYSAYSDSRKKDHFVIAKSESQEELRKIFLRWLE